LASSPRIVVQFLIPIREDPVIGSGTLHPAFRWKALQDALERSFGGWTAPDFRVRGAWIDPQLGSPVHDESRPFEVDVEEEKLGEIRSLLRRVCRTFVQQCIRVVILGRVEYVEAAPSDEPL
jgi:hypothetical protein